MRAEEPLRDETTSREHSMFGSLARTIRDIVSNVQEIIRSEVRLARTELKEEIASAKRAAIFYGGAALCALFALAFLLWAGAYALMIVLPPWAAALIIGVLMGILAGVVYVMARRETERVAQRAQETVETAKENVRWAKNRFR